MEALRRVFETAGFRNVSTLKASGNVVFESESPAKSPAIEDSLEKTLGFPSSVLLRKFEEIVESFVKEQPFRNLKEPDAKFYVTFMAKSPTSKLKIPLISSRGDVEIFSLRKSRGFQRIAPD